MISLVSLSRAGRLQCCLESVVESSVFLLSWVHEQNGSSYACVRWTAAGIGEHVSLVS